ncbi:MAG: copper oxidase [Thalassobium sp.]|nr:MAG: copper oxidase [Thalassobium sp.]
MRQTRRQFLGATAAFSAAAIAPHRLMAQASGFAPITARTASVQLAPEGYAKTDIWGYDGAMPGPTIRVQQGARVQREFVNALPQASSVHWHGIRIANAMDGVSGLTQDAVAPGDTFEYDFVVPDAGTYWFHAHNRSFEQVARGLHGALIVEEPVAVDVDRDEVLVVDDWLLNPETAQLDPDFEAAHDRSHAGRSGNFIVTNGDYEFSTDVKKGDRLRLRLINAANARIFVLSLAGLEGWAMAYDGMPLAQPEKIEGDFPLAPGQRVDLFVDVTAEVGESAYVLRTLDGQNMPQATFPVTAASTGSMRGAPDALPANTIAEIGDLADARSLILNMEGGAMGQLEAAILDGERRTFRQLADANQFWAFNGVIGMTDTPLATLARGETVRLTIKNDTAFPHAIHLHGMHFREVAQDGQLGPMRDTLLSIGGQSNEIAFVADNPGKWLLHCHMLTHAASGMMTWVDVA